MRNLSRLAIVFLLLISASAQTASLTERIKSAYNQVVDSTWRNPITATAVAIGVPTLIYVLWPQPHANRNMIAPAGAAFFAAAQHGNQPQHQPRHPPNPYAAMSEEQMVDLALKQSAAEAKPFQDLDMGAADYRFNLELFLPFSQLKAVEERVKFLKRVLYEHDQRFTEHAALLMFAQKSYSLGLQDMVAEFHQLPSSCYRSLLSFHPRLEEIDPAKPPALDFDELLHEYEIVRELRTTNAPHSDALGIIDRRKRQLIEDRILLHVISYFFGPALNDLDYSEEKAALAIEHLFGDAEALALTPKVAPAPVRLTEDEVRLKRLARFQKNKDEM